MRPDWAHEAVDATSDCANFPYADGSADVAAELFGMDSSAVFVFSALFLRLEPLTSNF